MLMAIETPLHSISHASRAQMQTLSAIIYSLSWFLLLVISLKVNHFDQFDTLLDTRL